jgi:F420-dependent oxidoreductase-like protein
VKAPVRLGLQIPNFDLPGVAPAQLLDRLTAIAGAAEDAGFDSLFVMDHLHQIPGVGPPENRMLEGNAVLAALAARTTRANLGLMVAGVTYRNPALLAKVTTTIDVLSGGRAILGIGGAWYEEEHRAYGFDFPPVGERLARLGEALQIARAMFTQEQSTFEGRYYRVENVMNNPRPIRGDIPILVGGSGERKTLSSSRSTQTPATSSATRNAPGTCSACSTRTAPTSAATRPRSRRRGSARSSSRPRMKGPRRCSRPGPIASTFPRNGGGW